MTTVRGSAALFVLVSALRLERAPSRIRRSPTQREIMCTDPAEAVLEKETRIKTTEPAQPRRPPTLKDVAELAGVSITTVSYVVSGRANRRSGVPEPTRSKVLAAAEKVGYRRNRTARALRKERTELVALVWHGPMTPWVDAISEQMEELSDRRDYGVVHLPFRDTASGRRVATLLQSGMVDGAIMLGTQHLETRVIRALAAAGLSLVVHSETMRPHGFDVVRHGEKAALAAAVDHLVEQGHQKIRILAQHRQMADHAARLAGAVEALARHQLDPEPITTSNRREDMYEVTTRLLRTDLPEAVLSMTDRGAVATVWAAHRLGIDVPGRLSVMGVGNTEEGERIEPSLTSVGDPTRSADASVERLFARIDEPGQPGRIIERPWELIVRSSSRDRSADQAGGPGR
ncbi:LacI family DNA-binding transcriptional regulator [Jiangella asiatica]|uniref:LacI family transcriptional regulator n=1 Tax=Jiangella asiatica TaxID=2530372 RepID=A0A4R5DLF2_9ACTN|nr:LacI family DNA-binding transcriptional regulator [Jiangella asiatica]TDE14919.1 LacI family transcriptional regulator [Jiangella asiatica]